MGKFQVPSLETDPIGLVVKITVVVPHRLLLTQKVDLRLPDLKDNAEIRAFGQVERQAVHIYNRATQPHQQPQPVTYDWERPGTARTSRRFNQPQPQPSSASRWGSTSRYNDD